jgi:Protein of unknown function (DUF1580)
MIDLSTEKPIPLNAATALIPPGRNGKRCHLSTLLRWILKGSKSPGGDTVKLEACRLGGRWITSREAIQRFSEALTPASATPSPSATRTPGQRSRAAERAGKDLEALGI